MQPQGYPDVVYYCANFEGALALATFGVGCDRSLDGGLTWPSLFPGYTAIEFLTVDSASRVYVIAGVMFQMPLLRAAARNKSSVCKF